VTPAAGRADARIGVGLWSLLLASVFAGCTSSAGPAAGPSTAIGSSAGTRVAVLSPAAGSPSPWIAADGSMVALADTPYTSERHGYSLTVPVGWTVKEVAGSGGLHPDEPGVDTFRDRFGHALSVVEEPAGTLDGWASAIGRHLEGEHALTADSTAVRQAAGVPVRITEYHLPIPPSYVIHYLDADLVHAGRGLTLSLESTTRDDPGDRAILDRFLDSLRLASS
jgi:hypothetical protein